MSSLSQNVEVTAGDSLTLDITVYESNLTDRADLAGCTARWYLSRSARSAGSTVFVQKSSGSGISISDGVVTVTIAPDDTKSMKPGVYYHECEIKDASNGVATVMSGTFTIRPGVIPAT